jgi:cytochrome bd-type quinol oxidase subunit 2
MNIKQFYVTVFLFYLSSIVAIFAYLTNNQIIAKIVALFFVLDTLVVTILLVVYGSPKIEKIQKERSRTAKVFRKLIHVVVVGVALFGLWSMFTMNVSVEKLFHSLDIFNLLKALFFGSAIVALLYYSFLDVVTTQKK